MPVYRNHTVLEIARGIKAFLKLEAGLTRGVVSADSRDRQTKNPLDLIKNGADTQSELVKAAIRNLRREVKISEATKESAKRFRGLEGKKGLKVHLGCGEDIRTGWVNVDLAPILPRGVEPTTAHPDATFINHDLRRGLPLEEGSCDFIYSSHFFEHLEYEHGLRLMQDCYKALRPGGVFRIVLPDLRGFFEAYLRGEKEYLDELDPFVSAYLPAVVESGTKTSIDYVNFGVYQNGEHKYIYDKEKLELILRKIGYSSVAPSSYREGLDLDVQVRRRYSFYMEAVK